MVSPFPSFGEGGVAESRGGRWIHNADNNGLAHSPTTSPYGYSSFLKEESFRYCRLVSQPLIFVLFSTCFQYSTHPSQIKADGKDLSFVTVRVVDKDGNLCPLADNTISFKVKGAGTYRAGANGNPASLESFQTPKMKVFSGMMTAIVSSSDKPGKITLEATGKGLAKGVLNIESK